MGHVAAPRSHKPRNRVGRAVGSALVIVAMTAALLANMSLASAATATVTAVTAVTPANPATDGTVTITATVTPAAAGDVQFEVDGSAFGSPQAVAAGSATLAAETIAPLIAGNHTITAVFTPTDPVTFDASTATGVPLHVTGTTASTVTVTPSDATPHFGASITLTGHVPDAGATGTITFLAGAVALGAPATLNGSGDATLPIATLAVGAHADITAVYHGDGTYKAATSAPTTVTVSKADTTTTISPTTPVVAGANASLTATVTPATGTQTPTGTVQFKEDANNLDGPQALVAGVTSLTTTFSTVGSHSITAVYSSDGNDSASTSVAVIQAVNAGATASVTGVSVSPGSPVFGQQVTLSAVVVPASGTGATPAGTVQFKDGGANLDTPKALVNGIATVKSSVLAVATHPLTAVYSGGVTYAASTSGAVALTVAKAATTTVVSTLGSQAAGSVTLTATVASTIGSTIPAGTVQFKDGAADVSIPQTLDGSGVATLNTPFTAFGAHSITALYTANDGDHSDSISAAEVLTITPGVTGSSTTLTALPASTEFGENVVLDATVVGAGATGTVQFMDGVTALATPQPVDGTLHATLTVDLLAVGPHSITAVYSGDGTYASSTSAVPALVTVSKAPAAMLLAVTPNPVTGGAAVTLTAHVFPTAATGTVTFHDGATTLGTDPLTAGDATFTGTLPSGPHTVSATYAGDTSHADAASQDVALTVSAGATPSTVALTASPPEPQLGEDVTLTAHVSPSSATGTVTFDDSGTALAAPQTVSGGVANLHTSSLALGAHPITATYNGDATRAAGTDALPVTIVKIVTTTVLDAPAPATIAAGDTVDLTATVTPSGALGNVSFLDVDGTPIGASPALVNGVAILHNAPFPAGGVHTITAVYLGDGTHATSTSGTADLTVTPGLTASTTTVTPSGATSPFGDNVTFAVTVTGAGADPTGLVTLLDGATVLDVQALAAGAATLATTALTIGAHPAITVAYGGDATYNASTSAPDTVTVSQVTPTVTLAALPANPVFNDDVVLTATLPADATGSVTFEEGAVTVGTATASAGTAVAHTTGLVVGLHHLTAVYAGDSHYLTATSVAADVTVAIMASSDTVLSGFPTAVFQGQQVPVTATVSRGDRPGAAHATGGTVTLMDGVTSVGTALVDANDEAHFNPVLSVAGSPHALTAVYAGDANHTGSTSSVSNVTVDAVETLAGLVLDAAGGIHRFGTTPSVTGGPSFDFDIARGVAVLPDGSGGYVLDGFGGLHVFGLGSNTPSEAIHGGPHWPGFDIARGVAILPDGSGGYVLDGYGALHPFAFGSNPMPPAIVGGPFWRGFDIARGVVLLSNTSGYVLDGFGGVHTFGGAPVAGGGGHWPGFDIARSLALVPNGLAGVVLDGDGGLHRFGVGGPPPDSIDTTGSLFGQGSDIFRGVAVLTG